VEDIDPGSDPVDLVPKEVLGHVRIGAERPGGGPIFVGIGPEREVDAYLRDVVTPRSRICLTTHPAT
jgi:hypothetical protein